MERPAREVVEIADAALSGTPPSHEQALRLCEVRAFTPDYYVLQDVSRQIACAASEGYAEIHGQIGIDANPCSKNCQFCSFAIISNARPNEKHEMPLEQILSYAHEYYDAGANCLSVMITGDYDFEQYLTYLDAIHKALPDLPIMANMGDFDVAMARELNSVGVTSVYHAIRMREGIITQIPKSTRVKTIQSAHEAGLKVATCVEMITPDCDFEDIVSTLELVISLEPECCQCGGILPVPNTKMFDCARYSWSQNEVFAAILWMMAGPKIFRYGPGTLTWAEVGTNPRDDKKQTEQGGMGNALDKLFLLYSNREWKVFHGPSKYWAGHGLGHDGKRKISAMSA